jgi:hypothetical protein
MHNLACTCLYIIKAIFTSTFHVVRVTLVELGIPVTTSCMHFDTKLAMLLVYLL